MSYMALDTPLISAKRLSKHILVDEQEIKGIHTKKLPSQSKTEFHHAS